MAAASLSDILTAAQNAVQAINNAARTYLGIKGSLVANGVAATTLVFRGAGRVGVLSVISGTGTGVVYDSALASNLVNPVCAIPEEPGVYVIDLPFNNGLVVAPGSLLVTVSYSTGGAIGAQQ